MIGQKAIREGGFFVAIGWCFARQTCAEKDSSKIKLCECLF